MVSWVGRGVVVLVVCLATTAAAMVSPDPGLAQAPPTPIDRLLAGSASQSEVDEFWRIIRGNYNSREAGRILNSVNPTQRKNILGKVVRSRFVSGFWGPGILVRASLIGTGAYITWKIYQHLDGDNTPDRVFDLYLDSEALGRNAVFNPAVLSTEGCSVSVCGYAYTLLEWERRSGTGQDQCPTTFGSSPCYRLEAQMCVYANAPSSVGPATGCGSSQQFPWPLRATFNSSGDEFEHTEWQHPDWDECQATGLCTLTGKSGLWWSPNGWRSEVLLAITRTFEAVSDGREFGGDPALRVQTISTSEYGAIPLGGVYVREDQLPDMLKPATETITEGATGGNASPMHTSTATDASDEGDTPAVAAVFDDPCGRAFINAALDAGYEIGTACTTETGGGGGLGTQTMTLLRPKVGETYADYITRLQAAGWLGSATTTVLDTYAADPRMGPDAVARIRVVTSTGVKVYYPASWPQTSPSISVNQGLELYVNPSNIQSPTPGGTGAPYDPDDTTCDPYIEATPSFAPLMGLDAGEVFPFGLFAWCADVLGELDAEPDAPVFTFDFGWLGIDPDYVVDLNVLDPYMSVIRTILSWVMWVGAVWWFAASLLGLRSTGDPGEAVDDVT